MAGRGKLIFSLAASRGIAWIAICAFIFAVAAWGGITTAPGAAAEQLASIVYCKDQGRQIVTRSLLRDCAGDIVTEAELRTMRAARAQRIKQVLFGGNAEAPSSPPAVPAAATSEEKAQTPLPSEEPRRPRPAAQSSNPPTPKIASPTPVPAVQFHAAQPGALVADKGAFAVLRPYAALSPGQSVTIPDTRMAPVVKNDTTKFTFQVCGAKCIFSDWASTALIRETGRLVWWGGGHGATLDGSVYELNLRTGERRRAWRTYEFGPSTPTNRIGVMYERDGTTIQSPERAPRSAHAYAGLLAIPGRDAFAVLHTNSLQPTDYGSAWPSPWADWEFDFARLARGEEPWKALAGKAVTGTPAGVVPRPDGTYVVHESYADYLRNTSTGETRRISRSLGWANEGSAIYDSKRDASIVAAVDQGVFQVDHNGGAISPEWKRLFAWADLGEVGKRGAPGIAYHAGRDVVVLWDGRKTFAWFGADRKLVRWTAPGAAPPNGPWSVNHKIHHLPELGPDIFLLVGGPDDDLHLIALPFDNPAAAQRAPAPAGAVVITASDNLQVAFDKSAAGPLGQGGKRVIKIMPGLYEQAGAIKGPDTLVECADGAVFRNKSIEGKAAIIIKADRVEWVGCRFEHPSANFEGEANLAAFRLEAKDFTLRKAYIRDYQMGILGGTHYNWKTKRTQTNRGYVHIFDTTIEDIAKVSYDTKQWQNLGHLIYIAAYDELRVERSTFRRSWNYGHLIKSRNRNTVILDSTLDQGDAPASLAIDIPNGGTAMVKNVSIIHGARSDNADVIGFAKEYWGDTPGNDPNSEYFGLTAAIEKLWPGPSSITLEGVSIRTEVRSVPHSEAAIWGVRGPNLPEVSISLRNTKMVATHGVPMQFSMRSFADLGGNAK